MAVHAEDRGNDTEPTGPPAALAQTRANTARQLCAALREDAELNPSEGLAMALTVLWSRTHKFDAADARWPDRDRFVACDAGAEALLQALLRLSGHAGAGAESGLGCDGHSVAAAIGMAVAERALAARFGKSLVDHRVWAACDAACLTRGGVQEAAAIAGQLKLDRLALLADAGVGGDDARACFAALGWAVKPVVAEDPEEIDAAIGFALRSRKPTLLWCLASGGGGRDTRATANAREAWRRVGAKGALARRAWLKRLTRHGQRSEFERALAGRLADAPYDSLAALRQQVRGAPGAPSPAALCDEVLERLAGSVPELVCLRGEPTVRPGERPAGRALWCGNRPQGLAGCLNGIAWHGGVLPLARARLVDLGDQLPFLRLAAAAGRRGVTIAVDAADDRGGVPELLGWLRAIPNLLLFRPGGAEETMECLELALRRSDGPCVIVAADAGLAASRVEAGDNLSARGGFVLAAAETERRTTLLASGAELRLALEARALLAEQGIGATVVSLPCWALFEAQDEGYRRAVLGEAPRFGVEAGSRAGWDRWLNGAGGFFGAEAVAPDGGAAARQLAQSIARRLASV